MLERLCLALRDGMVLRASNKSLGLGGRFIASLGWCCRKLGDPYALDRDWLEAEGRRGTMVAVSEGRLFRTEPISGTNRGGSAT